MSFVRADVVLARLNPNQGAEIGKIRPVVVLTATPLIAAGLPVVMVVPLTTQFWPELAALRVEIPPRERLLKTSYVVLEQTRSIDKNRIQSDVITRLTQPELTEIESKLKLMLGFA
ncbi:MazF family transcriptional regulator [Thiomicrospira aerophila AL3]|uniref:mRNA interferase n=1 Tax=Thiomicrospira aerophila AL3 TaxID=717772 RepID=W0DTM0_9GAMM|nr:type II toxin-antitoxin system PemK/MazF family toxin [Thiomicrospira aerophila]AHF01955.1 MazF family transcriptional regulator [Thiomicrospira aerophila AL3]